MPGAAPSFIQCAFVRPSVPPRPATSLLTTWPLCGASGPRWSCATRTSSVRWTSCGGRRRRRRGRAHARCVRGQLGGKAKWRPGGGALRRLRAWQNGVWLLHARPLASSLPLPPPADMTMMCRPAGARAACAAPSRRATSHPPHLLCCFAPHPPPLPAWPQEEAGLPVQDRLYRSLKLWSFYVDLEERLVGAGECGVGLQRTANNAPCARPARPPLQACAVHPSGAPLPLNTLPLTPPPPRHRAAWARWRAPRRCTRASWTCASPRRR